MKKAALTLCSLLAAGILIFLLGLWQGRRSAAPMQVFYGLQSGSPAPLRQKPELNLADREALAALPGISPELADRILDYREKHGAFRSGRELMNVEGMDADTLASILKLITIGGQEQ